MQNLLQQFEKPLLDNKFKDANVGNGIEFTYTFQDGDKKRSQKVEGLVIAKKHGKGLNGTITIRSTVDTMPVERIFPVHSSAISNLKVKAVYKVKRAKLYYLRQLSGKAARLKRIVQ